MQRGKAPSNSQERNCKRLPSGRDMKEERSAVTESPLLDGNAEGVRSCLRARPFDHCILRLELLDHPLIWFPQALLIVRPEFGVGAVTCNVTCPHRLVRIIQYTTCVKI